MTIVIDIGCSESVAFFTKIIPKLELNKDKIQYIVVTPTIKTHQNFSTTLSSLYRLLIVTNQLANDNVNFVERSFWYGNGYSTTETFKSTLVNINEAKATSNFHPGGPATKKDLSDLLTEIEKGLYYNRAYVMSVYFDGF